MVTSLATLGLAAGSFETSAVVADDGTESYPASEAMASESARGDSGMQWAVGDGPGERDVLRLLRCLEELTDEAPCIGLAGKGLWAARFSATAVGLGGDRDMLRDLVRTEEWQDDTRFLEPPDELVWRQTLSALGGSELGDVDLLLLLLHAEDGRDGACLVPLSADSVLTPIALITGCEGTTRVSSPSSSSNADSTTSLSPAEDAGMTNLRSGRCEECSTLSRPPPPIFRQI